MKCYEMKTDKIKVKVDGGYLVAERNPDLDFDGICIYFETNNGDMIDIVLTECKAQNDYKKIDVYTYEDVSSEDWTRKYVIDSEEINKVIKINYAK